MNRRNRIDELLVLRAVEGLDAEASAELAQLLEKAPDVDELEFDTAAAFVSLAAVDPRERMPSTLMEELMRSAGAYISEGKTS